MEQRTVGTVVQDWRARLDQRFSMETSQRTIRVVGVIWILAFLLKHSGAAWDVAWHFRYVFGALEPPHWLDVAGSALAAGLIIYQTITGKAVERAGFYVIQAGFVVFVISMPLDTLNHYLFGLDVTVWSPTHMLMFAGTTLMMVGLLYGWLRLAEPGRWRLVLALICCAFLLDDVMFMLGQQEYGAIALDALARGQTTASPELLAQAGRSPEQFVQGGIPHWIYPVWLILTSTLVLVAANRIQGWRWAATTVTLIYLAFRVVGYLALSAFHFPLSFIPVMLLGGAFVIDLAENRRWPPLTAAVALVAVYYPSAALVGRYTLMPQFSFSSAPFVLAVLWAGFAAADWWRKRHDRGVAIQPV